MAKTGKTTYAGTVLEFQKKGATAAWGKVLCATDALEIDWGDKKEAKDICLEALPGEKNFDEPEYSSQDLDYYWTQQGTNTADSVIKTAFDTDVDDDQIVEVRTTMKNETIEVVGTTYVVPYKVIGYKHMGETDGKWKTKVKLHQVGAPVEAVAA